MQSRTKKIEKSIYIYILNFKNCLFHSGAGISVSAGVGQAARGAVGFSDLTTDAKPSGDDDGGGGDNQRRWCWWRCWVGNLNVRR